VTHQVSHPYKTRSKTAVLYISLSTFVRNTRLRTAWQQAFPEFNLQF
jgi:hypothetical protein